VDLTRSPGEGRIGEWILWSAVALATTGVLFAFREEIGGAHVALAYLLVVLGASARGGRRLGFVLAMLCFLAFNFIFIPPYYTFTIHRQLDWLVLFAFLATSAVATQLLHRAQAEAEATRRRAQEIERLAALGAETLSAGRAEDAVAAIAEVIQSGLDVLSCDIYLRDRSGDQVRRVARAVRTDNAGRAPTEPTARILDRAAAGLPIAERADGTTSVARVADMLSALDILLEQRPRAVLIPLRVKNEPVGVLRIEGSPVVSLDSAQRRFAEALAYYAALGLERVHLTAEAEHADALREADRLKDALLAAVSHDLRTPLTTIKALSHDLAAGGDERAAIVEQEADRLNRFVSDLLDLSRLNAGALSVTPELIAVEDVLGAALQQVSGALEGRDIRTSLGSGESLLIGRFDFVHTLRTLVNLIANALKYSPSGEAVDVEVRREGEWIVFEVADRGPGISPADQERIFEPFYRGVGAPDVGGTGLGLPIARRSTELQGGKLLLSPRPGGGSVFTILLPAADVAELERISL
jgi:two-component system sensor histidine kinase KdpD